MAPSRSSSPSAGSLHGCATIDGAEALACGLVQKLVAADDLDGAVEAWLAAIVAAGPRAVRAQKALMRRWQALPLDEAIAAGIEVFAQAYESDEPASLMRAFLARKR